MGCSITEFNPAQYGVESHAWDLTNPAGQDVETVREVRDEIERRVVELSIYGLSRQAFVPR